MATTAMVSSAERWLDEVLLLGSINDVLGATMTENFSLPAGLGDVAIMSLLVRGTNIATVPGAATAARGCEAVIVSPDQATIVDYVGTSEWMARGGTLAAFDSFSVSLDPDALTLWRQAELLVISSPEMDVNAAPTGDLRVYAKVVRVRPIEAPARGPVRLVR